MERFKKDKMYLIRAYTMDGEFSHNVGTVYDDFETAKGACETYADVCSATGYNYVVESMDCDEWLNS